MKKQYDYIIIGGGLIGLSIAFGLSKNGRKCLILDDEDNNFRAARGNFGLIWVQGKGSGFPAYADWTNRSYELWSDFSLELEDLSGIKLGTEQKGGIHVCLTEDEYQKRKHKLEILRNHQNGKFNFEMLDNKSLSKIIPGIGENVFGGSYSEYDGHVNPLYLMKALHNSFEQNKGIFLSNSKVLNVVKTGNDFCVKTKDHKFLSHRLILSAGLTNKYLAPMVGLNQPVRPVKGQILVTEKVDNFISLPTTVLRQTKEGSLMIGDSHEELGMDVSSDPKIMSKIANRAVETFPKLSKVQIIRSWAALRVMSPDGLPIYDQSNVCPGCFAISCHSGVTLAAAHANDLANYIDNGNLGEELNTFSGKRFDVSKN